MQMAKTSILFKMLTVLFSYCSLIPKISTLVIWLVFEKKAFEMPSFQSPHQELGHYILPFPLICIYLLGIHFTSVVVINTSEQTSCCFNFTDFKILILVSHLKINTLSISSILGLNVVYFDECKF